jgi:hypothetical protein
LLLKPRINDHFNGPILDGGTWIDHYLPQWTTPDRSAARYDFDEEGLRLRIDVDQPAWRTADGLMRVSNIQTGTYSGPRGSGVGTHRHRQDGLEVITVQPTRRLWTATSGQVTVRASASADPLCMLGIWLVGFEESGPEDSGELCIAELFGNKLTPSSSTVRVGVKAHNDPRLVDDISDVVLPINATRPHVYTVRWHSDLIEFEVDGAVVKTCHHQRLAYEQQLMIDLFEFPEPGARDPRGYPKTAHIHAVEAWPHASPPSCAR